MSLSELTGKRDRVPIGATMAAVVIVGAGVIGLSLAYELARRGHSVKILDADQPGRGASSAAAGILPPPCSGLTDDAQEQLRAVAHQLHFEWHARLLAETGIDTQLRKCGGLYLAQRAAEAASLRVRVAEAASEGVRAELLDADEVVRCEPSLVAVRERILVGMLLPDEARIRGPLHLAALQAACDQSGVEIMPHQRCVGWTTQADRVVSVRVEAGDGDREIAADVFVVCSGARSPSVLAQLGLQVPIEPRRGQLVVWHVPSLRLNHIVNEGLRYLVPREDGRILAGATVEDVGWECCVTDEGMAQMVDFAVSWLPQLRDVAPETAWAGLRPWTPDGMPYMGPLPGWSNAWVCAGHFRSGLHLSPAVAVAMADSLDGHGGAWDLSPFRVSR
ncbi:MAG: FAD-dependent oxidoreductase [Pirellulales bacterium]